MWPFPKKHPETNDAFPFPKGDNVTIKTITQQATEEGIKFMHNMYGSNRFTVAYRPVAENGKFMEVSVAYVHPKDQFNKKHGARIAAERFFDGEKVIMPIRGRTSMDTYWNLMKSFSGE